MVDSYFFTKYALIRLVSAKTLFYTRKTDGALHTQLYLSILFVKSLKDLPPSETFSVFIK